jgi:hypothetical protein
MLVIWKTRGVRKAQQAIEICSEEAKVEIDRKIDKPCACYVVLYSWNRIFKPTIRSTCEDSRFESDLIQPNRKFENQKRFTEEQVAPQKKE